MTVNGTLTATNGCGFFINFANEWEANWIGYWSANMVNAAGNWSSYFWSKSEYIPGTNPYLRKTRGFVTPFDIKIKKVNMERNHHQANQDTQMMFDISMAEIGTQNGQVTMHRHRFVNGYIPEISHNNTLFTVYEDVDVTIPANHLIVVRAMTDEMFDSLENETSVWFNLYCERA